MWKRESKLPDEVSRKLTPSESNQKHDRADAVRYFE
jgi:hypothetical protein